MALPFQLAKLLLLGLLLKWLLAPSLVVQLMPHIYAPAEFSQITLIVEELQT